MMKRERMLEILLYSHVSEKSALMNQENNQYVFRVALDANKKEIRTAVENLFDVQVVGVQVVRSKKRVRRIRMGHRQNAGRSRFRKKAYVRLVPGQQIDVSSDLGQS